MLRRQPPLTYENALSRMAALCAKCEQCTPDLLKKMSSLGVSAGVAAKVISRLIELKFVDDRRFSKAYAHDKLHFSGWGRRKIKQGLWAKRLPPDIIESACDDFEDEEYSAIALRVIASKIRSMKEWPLSRESKIKVTRYAMQRGFEYPLIADLMRNYKPDSDDSWQ